MKITVNYELFNLQIKLPIFQVISYRTLEYNYMVNYIFTKLKSLIVSLNYKEHNKHSSNDDSYNDDDI